MHLSQPPPDPRDDRPRAPRSPSRSSTCSSWRWPRSPRTASPTPTSSPRRSSTAMAQVEGSPNCARRSAAQLKCPTCGAHEPAEPEVLRRVRRPRWASRDSAMSMPARRRRLPPPFDRAGRRGAHYRDALRRFRSDKGPLSAAARRARRGSGVARGAARATLRALARGARIVGDAGHGQDAAPERVPPFMRGGGGQRRRVRARSRLGRGRLLRAPDGDPSASPALPEDGGSVARLGWRRAREARRGLADIFGKRRLATHERRRLSPDERRFAAAEALRWALHSRERAGRTGSASSLAIDDLHSVDGASRNAFADAIAEPPLIPALLRGDVRPGLRPVVAGRAAQRRASSRGSSRPVVAKLLAATAAVERAVVRRRARAGSRRCYLEQLLRFTREQGSGAPTRLADLIALRVERLLVRRAARAPGHRRLRRRRRRRGDHELVPDDTNLSSALSVLLRAGMIEDASDGLAHLAPAAARDRRSPRSRPRCASDLHRHAAEVCEAHRASIEVLAMHEYFAQNAFQALHPPRAGQRRAAPRAGTSTAAVERAPPRPRARPARAVPGRARRPDARGPHLQPQARRGAREGRRLHRRRGGAPRGARHDGARAGRTERACSGRSRRCRTAATGCRRRFSISWKPSSSRTRAARGSRQLARGFAEIDGGLKLPCK